MFSSLNPYVNLISVTDDDPDKLIERIQAIRTPIKILSIVATNGRYTAFLTGDIRKKPAKGNQRKRKGKE